MGDDLLEVEDEVRRDGENKFRKWRKRLKDDEEMMRREKSHQKKET